jgi:hypothetical protein
MCVTHADSPERTFRFTAPSTAEYAMDTGGPSYDAVIFVRHGSCNGTELACDANFVGETDHVSVFLTAGQVEQIREPNSWRRHSASRSVALRQHFGAFEQELRLASPILVPSVFSRLRHPEEGEISFKHLPTGVRRPRRG